jgi:hypothetical protein
VSDGDGVEDLLRVFPIFSRWTVPSSCCFDRKEACRYWPRDLPITSYAYLHDPQLIRASSEQMKKEKPITACGTVGHPVRKAS